MVENDSGGEEIEGGGRGVIEREVWGRCKRVPGIED